MATFTLSSDTKDAQSKIRIEHGEGQNISDDFHSISTS